MKGRFPFRLNEIKQLPSVDLSKYTEDSDDVNEGGGSKKRKYEDSQERNITSLSSKVKEIYSFEDLSNADNVCYAEKKTEDGGVEYWVDCPLGVVSHRDGVHACDPTGKPSLSIFRTLGYCELTDTSLIHCRPYTGRTHQLRLHLQLCGNPIANDPCYGGELFFGNTDRKQKAIDAIIQMKSLGCIPLSKVPHIEGISLDKTSTDTPAVEHSEIEMAEQAPEESDEDFLKRTCK